MNATTTTTPLEYRFDEDEVTRLVRFEAMRMQKRLPPGADRDDLLSVGYEAAMEAFARADRFEPERFKATLRITVRDRMKQFCYKAVQHKIRYRPLATDPDTGEAIDLPDARTADPRDAAEARELVSALAAGDIDVVAALIVERVREMLKAKPAKPVAEKAEPPAAKPAVVLLTAADVARHLGASRSYVSRLAGEGVIPFVRVGNRLRFKPEAVAAFLKSREGAAYGGAAANRKAVPA